MGRKDGIITLVLLLCSWNELYDENMLLTKRKKFLQVEAMTITQMGLGVGEISPEV